MVEGEIKILPRLSFFKPKILECAHTSTLGWRRWGEKRAETRSLLMCCVLKNLSSHLSHIKRMQMVELGWRKHTHPHTEGHISLKQPWTQREGAVPGGSVRGEPSCCPGSRSHLPPRPHIQRGRKGKRLNERRRKENKSVWTWDLSLRISFYSAFLCFPGQVWTCWLESFTRKKSNPKTHPTTSPLSPVTKSAWLWLWNCGKWSWCQKLL